MTKRRVIFPPTDYWTNPKEHTMSEHDDHLTTQPIAADRVVLTGQIDTLYVTSPDAPGVIIPSITITDPRLGTFVLPLGLDDLAGIAEFHRHAATATPDDVASIYRRITEAGQ